MLLFPSIHRVWFTNSGVSRGGWLSLPKFFHGVRYVGCEKDFDPHGTANCMRNITDLNLKKTKCHLHY